MTTVNISVCCVQCCLKVGWMFLFKDGELLFLQCLMLQLHHTAHLVNKLKAHTHSHSHSLTYRHHYCNALSPCKTRKWNTKEMHCTVFLFVFINVRDDWGQNRTGSRTLLQRLWWQRFKNRWRWPFLKVQIWIFCLIHTLLTLFEGKGFNSPTEIYTTHLWCCKYSTIQYAKTQPSS